MIHKLAHWFKDKLEDRRWGQYYRLSAWAQERTRIREDMHRWDDSKPAAEQLFVQPVRIIVHSETDKQQLLKAFQYIHDMRELDTDYVAVNYLAHIYVCPELIEVHEPVLS